MVTFESEMVASYRLSRATTLLSQTIWLQFAIECLKLKSTGHFGTKFSEEGVDRC